MSKSHVTSGWLSQPVTSCPPGVDARIPRLLQWSSKESMQEVIAWVWRSVTHGNAVEQYTWALSVLIWTLLPEGMAYGHAKVELVACTLVELRQASRRRKPQRWTCRVARILSVGWFDLVRNLDTSLVRFWGLLKMGLCADSPGRKRCTLARHVLLAHTVIRFSIAHVSKMQTNPGIDFSGADYGEAPVGNAKDAAEERRLRCKGDNAKVRAPRRRPSSWRR